MKLFARLAKGLLTVSLTLSVLLNIGAGIIIIYVILALRNFRRLPALVETGTQVMATVTRVKTYKSYGYNFGSSGSAKPARTVRNIYVLIAKWQHPETGKTYTFRSPVRDGDTYPVGSSVPVLIDYHNPRWHTMANAFNDFKRTGDDISSVQE